MEKGRLIRNMECASCEHVFDCKGKPEHIVSGCVNYKKRKKDNEKGEVKKNERH